MTETITAILERCGYKGKFISAIKSAGLWDNIAAILPMQDISDVEKVYLYLHPNTMLYCQAGNRRRYLGLTRGYSDYCNKKDCNHCKTARSTVRCQAMLEKYGVDNPGKLSTAIENRNNFWNSPNAVADACKKRQLTNILKYGSANVFHNAEIQAKQKRTMIERFGVDNPSKSEMVKSKKRDTFRKNYGVDYPGQSSEITKRKKQTNIERYGFEHPMQNPSVAAKAVSTKIARGGFTKSNSSKAATLFIREYIKSKSYDITQCAYADIEYNLHEWGIYHNNRWVLYDLVVFEPGYRGDKSKIIEILEYHGPFHYSQQDANDRGEDCAYPWKSNKTTIKASYEQDMMKEKLAKSLTKNYLVVSNDIALGIDPNEVIAENVRKLESRYPGGEFDVHYSENRKTGDL